MRRAALPPALRRASPRQQRLKLKNAFIAHLMPHQVGVGVPGGLNMWATVVETMLQRDDRAVMCAIDLENCFNAVDRDMLIDECLRHPTLY